MSERLFDLERRVAIIETALEGREFYESAKRDLAEPEGAAVPAAPPENGPLGHQFQQPDTKREPLLSSVGLCAHWYRAQDKGPKRGYCARPFCDHWPLAPLAGEAEEPTLLIRGRGTIETQRDEEWPDPPSTLEPEPAPEPALIEHEFKRHSGPMRDCTAFGLCHDGACLQPEERHKAPSAAKETR